MKKFLLLCFALALFVSSVTPAPAEGEEKPAGEHEHHHSHDEHDANHADHDHKTHESHESIESRESGEDNHHHRHHHHHRHQNGVNNAEQIIADKKIDCPFAKALIELNGKFNVTEDAAERVKAMRDACTIFSTDEKANVMKEEAHHHDAYKKYVLNDALQLNDAFKTLLLHHELHQTTDLHEQAELFASVCELITK